MNIEYKNYDDHKTRAEQAIGAFDGDTLAGYIAWNSPKNEEADNDKRGYVHVLWVHEDYRRQGIGSELALRAMKADNRDITEASDHTNFITMETLGFEDHLTPLLDKLKQTYPPDK